MTAREVLIEARELIANEENWVENLRGPGPPQPVCAVIAINRVMPSYRDYRAFSGALNALARATGTLDIPFEMEDIFFWNDESTHEEILAAFDRAIALAVY